MKVILKMSDLLVSPAIITEFFRIGLVSRTISIDAIDVWATNTIAEESSPSIELCDLASAKHTDRAVVIDALRSYKRTDDDLDLAWAMYCEFIYDSLKSSRLSLKDAVYALYDLDKIHELPEFISMPISIIEDDYCLARDQVFGTFEEVEVKFLRLLESFFDEETPKYLIG